HAGCALEHGLPQDDRQYSLDPSPKKKGSKSPPPVKVCPECQAVLPLAARVCPHCGVVLSESHEMPGERRGELVEVTPEQVRLAEWNRLCLVAKLRGFRPAWAHCRFFEKFHMPAPKMPDAGRPEDVEAVLERTARNHRPLTWSELDRCSR
ncbi:MAG: zinc ribbon domain-containing protein, partial [Pseudomonadota bacterium]